MATYQANITKNLEPATASVNPLIRAAEASAAASRQVAEGSASIAKTLTGVGETLFKGYQDYQVASAEQEAVSLAGEFFQSGQAASVAGRQVAQVEAQQNRFQTLSTGPQMPEGELQRDAQMAAFTNEVDRLKKASMGGMSNAEYVSRIDALTKKAIAQTPGMSDKIRERVGAVTGLSGADRWAQMNYVKDRFSEKEKVKQATPEEMALLDIKMVAPMGTYGSHEDLLTLYRTNRPEYDRKMGSGKETLALKTQTDVIKNNVSGLNGQGDLQADGNRASFMAIFSGGLGSSVLTSTANDKENIFGTTLDLMAKGANVSVDIVPFKVQIDMHAAQMRTNIDGAKRQTYVAIDSYLANNPNVSEAKRQALYADVDRAANLMQAKYADDKGVGLVAMANIMKTYRDKGIAEKTQLVNLAIQQQSAMQNNPMVMAYWAGGEARENLKRTNRSFFEFMTNQEQELTSSITGVRNDIQGATSLANVQRVMVQAGTSPTAVAPDPIAEPNVTRAAHQALAASAVEILKKSELTPIQISTVSAALATSAEYGANSLLLAKNYKTLGASIEKLTDQDQGVIKSNVSNSVQKSIISINDIKTVLEAKYKTTLTLGVNDAGEISVVVPTTKVGGSVPAPRLGTTPGTFVRPSDSVNLAAQEFMKQAKPMLNNIVYSRAMLTKETPQVIGADFATLINTNQTYTGFYSAAAKSVAPTPIAAPAATPAATTKGGALKVGDVVNGYRYNGGDTNVESSWTEQ